MRRRLFILGLVMAFASSSLGAATYRTSAAGGGTVGTTDRTATITPAVGDLFVVFCAAATNTNDTPTCTDDNSGAYTLIGVVQFGSAAGRFSLFVRNALLANTTSTTVTVATGSNASAEIVVMAIAGMARTGSSAVRSSGSQANQAIGTPAPALSLSALTGNVTLGAVCNATNPATMTAPASWTERQDVGQGSPNLGLETVSRDSGFTGTTVTWGSSSASTFASWILELDGSAAPSAAILRNRTSSRARTGL